MDLSKITKRYKQLVEEYSNRNYVLFDDEINRKVICSVLCYIAGDYSISINTVSKITGISSSSVQRYLKLERVINLAFGKEVYSRIQESLINNKVEGNRKGGINSFLNNASSKGEDGKFTGSTRELDDSRLQKKMIDVRNLVTFYLSNGNISLNKLAQITSLNRNYIYDCLTSNYVEDIFGKEISDIIKDRLCDSSPDNISKLK